MSDQPSGPIIPAIAAELNVRAQSHLVGTLQDIRTALKGFARRPGRSIFSGQTITPEWAFHHGGRTELQFNIGIEDASGVPTLRHGVAFSFERSQTLPDIAPLRPKVRFFNEYLDLYPDLFADMLMWHYRTGERSADRVPAAIPPELVAQDVFVFLGKRQPLAGLDYELILDDFDRLIPLYRYVESGGNVQPLATPSGRPFAFRPGLSDKKSSTIASQVPRDLNVNLRHNEIQKALYQLLAARFGPENVATEQDTGIGTFIDVAVRHPGGDFWFYEIKTAYAPRACIREAVGQLLEYANWPGSPEAKRLIVVGEQALDHEGAEYLGRLRDRFAIPISYEQVSAGDSATPPSER